MEELDSIFKHAWAQLRAMDQGDTSSEVSPSPVSKPGEDFPRAKPRIQAPKEGGVNLHHFQSGGIEGVRKRKNNAFSKMNRLHASLEWLPTDQQRLESALEILELEREVQACWQVIDHFTETGELTRVAIDPPEEEPFDPSEFDTATLIKMRNSARSYVSKAKRKGYTQEKVEGRLDRIRIIEEYLEKQS